MHAVLVPATLTFGASLAIVSGARVASAFCLGALYGAKRSGDKPHQCLRPSPCFQRSGRHTPNGNLLDRGLDLSSFVARLFPGSSAAEQAAVNRPVGGSNPSWGAKLLGDLSPSSRPMIRLLGLTHHQPVLIWRNAVGPVAQIIQTHVQPTVF